MSNHLSMSNQQAIIGLIERGWSQHRVARELDVDRKTVRRHVRLNQAAKSSLPTAGSAEPNAPISTAGSASVTCCRARLLAGLCIDNGAMLQGSASAAASKRLYHYG